MAKAFKCDNCGEYFDKIIDTFFDVHVNKEHNPSLNFNLTIKVDVQDFSRDVCPTCLKLFFEKAIKEIDSIKKED